MNWPMNTTQQVAEFVANLLIAGMKAEEASVKGYEFSLALLTDQQPKDDDTYVSATMMARASMWVKDAMPEARRIFDLHYRSR